MEDTKDKKVVKILTENNLYVNNSIKIKANKISRFYKKYSYRNNPKEELPSKVKRDKKGHIILDDLAFIRSNYIPFGHTNSFWYLLENGEKVLLKEDDLKTSELELLFKMLADNLNIPCASYDYASLDDKHYTLSYNFLKQDEHLIDYYEFEEEYRSIQKLTELLKYKIYSYDKLIKKASNINDLERLYKTLYIDILTNNYDRLPHNYKMITNGKSIIPSKLFDNGNCCNNCGKSLYNVPSVVDEYDEYLLIKELFKNSNFRNWYEINKYNIDVLNKLESLYKEKNIEISSETIKLFSDTIKNKSKIIYECYKK
ncbi:MAG: hypothetical protein IJ094_10065 [Bacilli bacterium]|nr:hypothetical protein [Bacilli bacterium]